jgi:D-alanyl-D-alanine carboxypeptidase
MNRTNTAISRVASAIAGLALLGIAMAPATVRADPVDNYIAAKMAEKSIPGLALAVIRDGHVIKEKAYGYANLELKAPVTLQTSFPWASTTKVFTAVALMQMVEQGKITLDQPVSTIVPGLPAAWSKVTIRHCLSHTTGLPYAVEDQFNINVLDGNRDQLLAKLSSKPVVEPGTQIDYNTTDFVLLTNLQGAQPEGFISDIVALYAPKPH